MNIRYATSSDQQWIVEHDQHVSAQWIERCLQKREIIIAIADTDPLGFMRFSYFWGKIPYMDMVWVMPEDRCKGVGTALCRFWQQEMQQKDYTLLMTSSMQNEPEAQSWHLRNGFTQSGQLTFGQVQTVPEVFFVKDIKSDRSCNHL